MKSTAPVMFVTGGTRGDVQPYVVLAHALKKRGVPAVVAASQRWRTFVEQHGADYYELPPDPVELLLQTRYKHALMPSMRGVIATVAYLAEMRPYVANLRAILPRIHHDACMVVAGIASQWVSQPEVWHTMPFVWGLLQPVVPTRDFVSPMITQDVPPTLRPLTHQLMNRLMWLSWRLNGMSQQGGLMKLAAQPAFFAFSRVLVPPWSDIQSRHAVTGWLGQSNQHTAVSPRLATFLNDDSPFVVATFGTPAANETADIYQIVVEATRRLGVRLLLQVPHHHRSMPVSNNVCVITDEFDHQTVFAQAAAVIHHGGAGTTHACIAAGVPMLIVPRGIDQYFWGKRVINLMLSPGMLMRNELRVDTVMAYLMEILYESQYRIQTKAVMTQMQQESAIDDAVEMILAAQLSR